MICINDCSADDIQNIFGVSQDAAKNIAAILKQDTDIPVFDFFPLLEYIRTYHTISEDAEELLVEVFKYVQSLNVSGYDRYNILLPILTKAIGIPPDKIEILIKLGLSQQKL